MSRQRSSQSRSQQSQSQRPRSQWSRSAWSRYSWSEVCDLARALQSESRSRRALSEDEREDEREDKREDKRADKRGDAQTSSDRSSSVGVSSMGVSSPSTSIGSPDAEPQTSQVNHTREPRITRVERIRDQRAQQNLSAPGRPVGHLSDHAHTDFDAARFKESWRASRSLSEDSRESSDQGSNQDSNQDSNHRLYAPHHGGVIHPSHQKRETRQGQRSEASSYISPTSSSSDSPPSGWELLRDHFLAQRKRRLEVENMETSAPEHTARGASDPTAD